MADDELVLGPFYGLRGWRVLLDGRLTSPYGGLRDEYNDLSSFLATALPVIWDERPIEAGCASPQRHEELRRTFGNKSLCNRCGFYSYRAGLVDEIGSSSAASNNIIGVILCWGELLAGPKGQRSEFAQIQALVIPTPWLNIPARDMVDDYCDFAISRLTGARLTTETYDNVRSKYPNTKIYSSWVQMIRDYGFDIDLAPLLNMSVLLE